MKHTNTLAKPAALCAVLFLGGSAWLTAQSNQWQIGQPEGGPAPPQGTNAAYLSSNIQPAQLLKVNRGSALIGATVKNQQGEQLGKIRDLVTDFTSDRVAYLVLDTASGVFSAQKLHAVPLRAFQLDPAGTSLILITDKDKLTAAAGFDKNNWPAASTATWGAEPFWKATQGTSSLPAQSDLSTNNSPARLLKINKGSTLIGITVKNPQGEELGKINDLVVDFNSDRVAYLVLDSATGLLSSSILHAVPLRAFQTDAAGTFLILNANKEKLAASAGFDKNNWPAATTATWGAEPFWQQNLATPDALEGHDMDLPINDTRSEPKATNSSFYPPQP